MLHQAASVVRLAVLGVVRLINDNFNKCMSIRRTRGSPAHALHIPVDRSINNCARGGAERGYVPHQVIVKDSKRADESVTTVLVVLTVHGRIC